jgi:hypothetical protein
VLLEPAPESLLVQMLLETPGIKLFDFAQSEAYSRRFPFMSPVILPTGASRDPFGPNAARCCSLCHSTGIGARSGDELTTSAASRELGRSIAQTCGPFMR